MNLSFLVVSWFLTFGYVPDMGMTVNDTGVNISRFNNAVTVSDIGLSVTAWDKLTLYTSLENYQYYSPADKNVLQFSPFKTGYKIGMTFTPIKNVSFDLSHVCEHPVSSDNVIEFPYNYGQTRISVTFKGSQRL